MSCKKDNEVRINERSIRYCPVWRVLWVYNTREKSGRGRSPRPLFSRVLYTHNTRQTGQYLIYTMVTMHSPALLYQNSNFTMVTMYRYKANTVQFCARLYQNCETTEALLYQNSTVWRVLLPRYIKGCYGNKHTPIV